MSDQPDQPTPDAGETEASEPAEMESAEASETESSDPTETASESPEAVEPERITRPPEGDSDVEGSQFSAEITGIETVSASVVPVDYPVEIATAEAVAIEFQVTDESIIVTYLEPTDRGPDDRLERILALAETPGASVETLLGSELLLVVEDGYYMPVAPEGSPRGYPWAVYGIFLGLFPSLIIAAVGIFSPGASFIAATPFVVAWLVGTFLFVPVSLYFDAWNLRTTTSWNGAPRTWAGLSAIPGLNVIVVPLYLFSRESAHPIV